MEENTTSQPQNCGCDCEQCTGNSHEACTTGMCEYNKEEEQPETEETQDESQQQ